MTKKKIRVRKRREPSGKVVLVKLQKQSLTDIYDEGIMERIRKGENCDGCGEKKDTEKHGKRYLCAICLEAQIETEQKWKKNRG